MVHYDLIVLIRFLRRFARVCSFDMPTMTFGRYVLEMALMEYSLNVDTSESLLAAAALALTAKVNKPTVLVHMLF